MANALLYCSWGRGKEQELGERPGWNPIYHGDIKEQNILMTDIVASQHSLYPCLKLCDFGELSYSNALGHSTHDPRYGMDA